MGKRRVREGAGDLQIALSRKPRQWQPLVPPRTATADPQPLPAAPPGSGESVGTKWPPLPLRAARPGRSHGRASRFCCQERAAGARTASTEQKLRVRTRRGRRRRTARRRAQLHSPRKPSHPGQSHLFPVPSHAGVRAA